MKILCSILVLLLAVPAVAQTSVLVESVSGGVLDQVWIPAFFQTQNVEPITLMPGDPGYDNPSGDHTVAGLTNTPPEEGGLGKAVMEPAGLADYRWEGWIFTGDGNTRRGLVVRAEGPASGFTSCYQFVLQPGMLNLTFRLLSGMGASTLQEWFTTSTASGFPATNSWHHMAVEAEGSSFRVWWDGEELTAGSPIVDATNPTGYVGVYNFRFDLGGVTVLFDDLVLSSLGTVATYNRSWGAVKSGF